MTGDIARRGSSGAFVDVGADKVTKWGTGALGARVREQGIWLLNFHTKWLPEVQQILSTGYEMEILDPIDVLVDDITPLLDAVFTAVTETQDQLRSKHMSLVNLDIVELRSYVAQLSAQVNCADIGLKLLDAVDKIHWEYTARDLVWTHGDPITDNIMVRGDQLVLIDPIPPCPALPSLAIVDWGRLVQSAAGYEQTRYLGTFPSGELWRSRVHHVLNQMPRWGRFDVEKVRGALFYSIVHTLRGARTAPNHTTRELIIGIAYDLLGELEQWML